jgi:hypothetical protein
VAVLLVVGIAVYALAGLLLAPRGVENRLRAVVEQNPGLTLELAALSVNPFTLGFSAANVIIIGPENTPLVSIERLDGHVHPASLIERAWILRRVTILGPRAELPVENEGFSAALRLAAALLRSTGAGSGPGSGKIVHLAVHRGELALRDIRVAGVPAAAFDLGHLELDVRAGGAASPGNSPFDLTATVNRRARLEAAGTMRSHGETPGAELSFRVDDASVFNPYVNIGTDWSWSAGRLQSDAIVELREGRTRISGDVELRDLDVARFRTGESVFAAAALFGRDVVVDGLPSAPTVDGLRLENPRLRLERGPGGRLEVPPWLVSILDPADASVRISSIELANGSLGLTDRSLSPPLALESHDIGGTFTRPGSGRNLAAVSLRGRFADGGEGEIIAEWRPRRPLDFTRVDVRMQDFPLPAISPYLVQAIGRAVPEGAIDLTVHSSVEDERLRIDNRLVIRDLRLAEATATLPARQLPLDLAAALLEDDEGRIAMNVRVPARQVGPGLDPTAVLTNALADFVTEVTASPFEHLVGLVGRPDMDLGRLAFPAGSPEVTDDTAAKLAMLDAVLSQRPRLGLIVHPGYDPVIDRAALARQQVGLHVNLATSSGTPGQPGHATIDFSDRKVHTVLDEFAENRLSQSVQEAIKSRHAERDAAYYRDVFEVLVDNEEVARTALSRLARYRAQTVVRGVVESGDNAGRIRQADVVETVEPGDTRGAVRLDVERVIRDGEDSG